MEKIQLYEKSGKPYDGPLANEKEPGFMRKRYCSKCGGKGYGPWFQDGGICYSCWGQGDLGWEFVKLYTKAELEKIEARAEKARAKRLEKARLEKEARKEKFTAEFGELIERARGYADRNDFVASVVGGADEGYWPLSEKQVEALEKVMRIEDEKAAAPKVLAPVGKQSVVAEVVSFKEQASRFGTVTKMLIKLESGAKAYGTAPAKLFTFDASIPLVGIKVSFTADFEASPTDPSFSFFSRPTKVSLA